jgi:phosphoglycerol transferase MdoB-like AlkP superfamily enzyme
MSTLLKRGVREEKMSRLRDMVCRTDRLGLLIGVLLVGKVLLTREIVFGRVAGIGVVADVCAVVATVVVAFMFGRRVRRPLLFAAATFVSLGLFIVAVYASYFDEIPSLTMLPMLRQLGSVGDAVVALLSWQLLLLVLDLPILFLLLLRAEDRLPVHAAFVRTAGSVALAATIAFSFAATALPKPLDARRTPFAYGFAAYEVASTATSVSSGAASALGDGAAIQSTIDALTGRDGTRFRKPGSPKTGSMQGRNLIVIQVEALQAGLVGARYDGQPIVPNFERFVSQSVYFPNTYSQIGRGNTSDAEFISNTSLYPAQDEPSSVAYARKEIPSLPRLLRAAGYKAITMHANDAIFWNRIQLYPALGFDEVYDRRFFGEPEAGAPYGASDEVFYARAIQILWAAQSEETPFYAQLVTVSSHYPFTWASGRGGLRMSADVAKTNTGKYLQAQSYADQQFGWFLDQLEVSGLLDDSVVIVYGDHFGLRFDNDTYLDQQVRQQVFRHAYNRADFYNVPLALRLPGVKAKKDPDVIGQVDIMPTVADLFGLDTSGMPLFGESVFVDAPTLLTRASSIPTYIDDEIVYLQGITNGEDRWYSSRTQKMLTPPQGVPERMANTRRLVELSGDYASSLPERPDATDEVGVVPDPAVNLEKSEFR